MSETVVPAERDHPMLRACCRSMRSPTRRRDPTLGLLLLPARVWCVAL